MGGSRSDSEGPKLRNLEWLAASSPIYERAASAKSAATSLGGVEPRSTPPRTIEGIGAGIDWFYGFGRDPGRAWQRDTFWREARVEFPMGPSHFRTKLVRPEGIGTWTFAPVPGSIVRRVALRSHQRVKGTIDGVPFQSSLMPLSGGALFLVVNQGLRDAIGKRTGDTVHVRMELDARPVRIPVPASLTRALSSHAAARRAFEKLAPSHRKAFAVWIASAKKEETRDHRVAKALKLLSRGEALN